MKEEDKNFLLKLARNTLKNYFQPKRNLLPEVPEKFKVKRGVFVTLHKNGKLRGCIGHISPIRSIYESVKDNALNAAFHDPRFPPLKEEELNEIKIEISLLSVPKKLEFKEPLGLIRKLKPRVDGVILEKDGHQATFLPQVWEELLDPYDFLRHLSWKAGLSVDAWKTAYIYTYAAEAFEEND